MKKLKISIRYKFIIGYIVIFLISLVVLKVVVKKEFENANEKVIDSELLELQQSSGDYIRQYFIINKVTIGEKALAQCGGELVKELGDKNNCNVALYNKVGQMYSNSLRENGHMLVAQNIPVDETIKGSDKDLKLAIQDKAAYVINNIDGKTIVNFSFPLYIDQNNIGIVRVSKDCTELYKTYTNLLVKIELWILFIFAIILIFSYWLSNRISLPIIKLSSISNDIAKGIYDTDISVRSKDEVGELTENFNNMKNQIKEQIETIKNDKNKLLENELYRKNFFDNVTHELKTPLTTISGYAQIISEDGFEDKEFVKRGIGRIKLESERLHTLVVELLEISKLDIYKALDEVTSVDAAMLVASVCGDMELKAQKYGISIDKSLENKVFVMGDENHLRQVLINVIDNAIKYGRVNSVIAVQVSNKEGLCCIVVENKGEGIPKEKISEVFDAFYMLDKKKTAEKGSCGLGLFISKSIVENHGGTIDVESVINEYAKVTIKIPLFVNKLDTFVYNSEITEL